MSAPRFHVATALPRDQIFPATHTLDAAAAQHLRVLRLTEGDALTLFDGAGGEFLARVESLGKRDVMVSLQRFSVIEREATRATTLVQALATGDKMDWIIQKATELGVAAIVPVMSARGTVKLDRERADKRAQHWRAVAVAACEQCGRNRVPIIYPVMEFTAWAARESEAVRVMLHPVAQSALSQFLATEPHLALVVGPEGGFTDEEIALAERHGIARAAFGPRVLRTETAGMAALAARLALSPH